MNQIPNSVIVAIQEIEHEVKKGETTEDKFRLACKAVVNHWLVIDEESRFKTAVGALILLSDEETREVITEEMKSLSIISAIMTGVPVDLDRVVIPKKTIGLVKIWQEVKAENDR